MKGRVAAFMLVWAYLACGLWLPLGVANVDWGLYLFPPGYFFALGGFIGFIGEWLSHRWERRWVVIPLLALSCELGLAIYGGHAAGLSLSVIFAFSTLCSCFLTPWLARFTWLVRFSAIVGGILCVAWLMAPFVSENYPGNAQASPNGEFVAWVSTNDHGGIRAVRVGPRHGFLGAFGGRVAGAFESWIFGSSSVTIDGFQWKDENTLLVFTGNSDSLKTEEPSVLLPIQVTRPSNRGYLNQ